MALYREYIVELLDIIAETANDPENTNGKTVVVFEDVDDFRYLEAAIDDLERDGLIKASRGGAGYEVQPTGMLWMMIQPDEEEESESVPDPDIG